MTISTFTTLVRTPDETETGLFNQRVDELVDRLAEAASATDSEDTFPVDAFGWLADAGLLSVTLPGRSSASQQPKTEQLLHLLKRIGSGNLAVGRIYEGHINALNLIDLYATSAQKQRWYADVSKRQRLFSVWNTQAGDGVRIHALGNGRYRLEGCKTFCSGAGWIHRPLVTGELVGEGVSGWQMCILPTEKIKPIPQDSRFWQPLGMRASVSYKLDFTDVELTHDDLLGQPDDYYRQPHFSGGAIRFAAVQLGGAEALFDATRSLLQSMNRTDDPFQRARLAEMTWLVESGNQWLTAAGQKNDKWLAEGEQADKIVAYANMTRTAIEDICLRVMPLAERCVGARGLMRPLPFERIHRDLTFYLRQPAPDATVADIGRFVSTNPTPIHDLWH